jgi:hypothetical protein
MAGSIPTPPRASRSGPGWLGPSDAVNGRMVSRWPAPALVTMAWSTPGYAGLEAFAYALGRHGRGALVQRHLNFGATPFTDFQRSDLNAVTRVSTSGREQPAGALLLGDDVLLVPNGHAGATPLDRRTGKLLFWPPGGAQRGTDDDRPRPTLAKYARAATGSSSRITRSPTATPAWLRCHPIAAAGDVPYLKPGEIHRPGQRHRPPGSCTRARRLGLPWPATCFCWGRMAPWSPNAPASRPRLSWCWAGGRRPGHPRPRHDPRVTQASSPGGFLRRGVRRRTRQGPDRAGAPGTAWAPPACAWVPRPASRSRLPRSASRPRPRVTATSWSPRAAPAAGPDQDQPRLQARGAGPSAALTARSSATRSTAAPRHEDSQKFGPFKFRPTPALASPAAVRAALKTTKPSPIVMGCSASGVARFGRGARLGCRRRAPALTRSDDPLLRARRQ